MYTAGHFAGCSAWRCDVPGEFVRVATLDQLSSGKLIGAKIGDEEICLINAGNSIVALSAICTHAGCELVEYGEVDGDELECSCHGSRFVLATGTVSNGPARSPLKRFDVKTEGRDVLVSGS